MKDFDRFRLATSSSISGMGGHMISSELGANVPTFKIRWRGYDRAAVDEYLRETLLRESMALLNHCAQVAAPP